MGSHVARHLAGLGYAVCAIARAPRPGSTDRLLPPPDGPADAYRAAVGGLDAIVHCAAQNNDRGADEASLLASNAGLTGRLATAAADAGAARFVFLSSIRAVAGPGVAIGDETVPMPADAYGRSKLAGERAALAAEARGFRPLVLRLPPVYGHGMRGNLGLLLRLARLPLPLPLGGLQGRRSLVSADAAARAVATLLGASGPARSTYLASDLAPVTVPQIVAAFRRGLGRRPGLVTAPQRLAGTLAALAGHAETWRNLAASQECDPAALVAEGWTPEADSTAGLQRLAALLRAP